MPARCSHGVCDVNVYNPYNLAAAKPGEPFVAKFYEIVTVRKTNPGELQPSASVAEGVISASPGQTPCAVVGHGVQLVVTVEAINRELETITVKAADGTDETVHVSNPDNFKHLKVGDGIVVTLWKVVAVALEKESRPQ